MTEIGKNLQYNFYVICRIFIIKETAAFSHVNALNVNFKV